MYHLKSLSIQSVLQVPIQKVRRFEQNGNGTDLSVPFFFASLKGESSTTTVSQYYTWVCTKEALCLPTTKTTKFMVARNMCVMYYDWSCDGMETRPDVLHGNSTQIIVLLHDW